MAVKGNSRSWLRYETTQGEPERQRAAWVDATLNGSSKYSRSAAGGSARAGTSNFSGARDEAGIYFDMTKISWKIVRTRRLRMLLFDVWV
jgi:hypothetical protein